MAGVLVEAWQLHQQHLLSYLRSVDGVALGVRVGRGAA